MLCWKGTVLKNDGTVKGTVRWVRCYGMVGTDGYGRYGTVGMVVYAVAQRRGTVGPVVRYGQYGGYGGQWVPLCTHRIVTIAPPVPRD